jgi:hypothetical protein
VPLSAGVVAGKGGGAADGRAIFAIVFTCFIIKLIVMNNVAAMQVSLPAELLTMTRKDAPLSDDVVREWRRRSFPNGT